MLGIIWYINVVGMLGFIYDWFILYDIVDFKIESLFGVILFN